MTSLLTSLKLVYYLIFYNKNSLKNITIVDDVYNGKSSDKIPFKLFSPNKPKKQILIIYPGASPTAEEHPGLIMLGCVLSQAGYTVYIPRIPSLKKLIIQPTIVDDFGYFYSWLIKNKNIKSNNISLIGISFGGAITLKLFTSKKFQNQLPKSIITYGTYFNFESVLDFFSTGKILIKNEEKKITPHPWGLIVMFYNYLSTIKSNLKIKDINKILAFQIKEKEEEIEKNIYKLDSKEQIITRKILECQVDEELINYIKLIKEKNQDIFNSLSPKSWNQKIKIKTFIFHGANDSMIPFTEAVKLSNSIPNSELLISYLYEHKEIAEDKSFFVKILELGKILKFFYNFIAYNEN